MSPTRSFLQHRPSDIRSDSPWSQFRHVHRTLVRLVQLLLAEADPEPGAVVLDYGCADQPYRGLLDPTWIYLGADIAGNPAAEVVVREDGTLPVEDESVDLVLSTQVLEHVADPMQYLGECQRILRTGGGLVLTTHGIMYYHPDPGDYWRWTADGLSQLLEANGFRVRSVVGGVGLVPTSLQFLQDATFYKVPRVFRRPYALVMQQLIARTDRRGSEANRRANAMVLAVHATKEG